MAYWLRMSDWVSDFCSSYCSGPWGPVLLYEADALQHAFHARAVLFEEGRELVTGEVGVHPVAFFEQALPGRALGQSIDGGEKLLALRVIQSRRRSEEHTSELQSLMRITYAVFCLKNKTEIQREKTNGEYT